MSERWLPVVGFEGKYEVSDLGRVRGVDRMIGCRHPGTFKTWKGRILAIEVTHDGHCRVNLRDGKRSRRVLLHRVVLEAFVGLCPAGMQACHDPDRDPANNRLGNLRWDTAKANSADSLKHGTRICGEKQGSAKLTADDVRVIRQTCRLVRSNRQPDSAKLIAKKYGVGVGTILRIVHRQSWRHIA